MHISQTLIFLQDLIRFSFTFHIRIKCDVFTLAFWLAILRKNKTVTLNIKYSLQSHRSNSDISMTLQEQSTVPFAPLETAQKLDRQHSV